MEDTCKALDLNILGISSSPFEACNKLDELIEKNNTVPDIILCDIYMNDMDGYEFTKKVKGNSRFEKTKFVAVTSDISAETSMEASSGIFDGFIVKPFQPKEMIFMLNSLLANNDRDIEDALDAKGNECLGVRVLVVEDVKTNQILFAEYFNLLGCVSDYANNGHEAVNMLKRDASYDLCLMDLQMPVMGGIEATEIIRKEISMDLPIIALTAAVLEQDEEAAMEVGMNGFITKPVNISKLKDIVRTYARKR